MFAFTSRSLLLRGVQKTTRVTPPLTRYLSDLTRKDESFVELKIDRSSLGGGYDSVFQADSPTAAEISHFKEPLTPLGKELQSYINHRGPMSLNEFMTQALTHNLHGYYQNKLNNSNKIGSAGDFITSPEISSLFGEMITIWCVSMWENMKCPTQFKLVECGPGNGTLMKQILSISSRRFPAFHAAAQVHLVEVADEMQRLQFEALGCTKVESKPKPKPKPMCTLETEGESKGNAKISSTLATGIGSVHDGFEPSLRSADGSSIGKGAKNNNSYRSDTREGIVRDADVPRRAPGRKNSAVLRTDTEGGTDASKNSSEQQQRISLQAVTADGVSVTWHKQFFQIADDDGNENKMKKQLPVLAIGQEFLDTFPVYQFIHTSGGWREKLVDVDTSLDSPYHFRIVLASKPTPASHLLLGGDSDPVSSAGSPNTTDTISLGAVGGVKTAADGVVDMSTLVSEKSLLHGLLQVRGQETLDLGDLPLAATVEGAASTGVDASSPSQQQQQHQQQGSSSCRTVSAVNSIGIEVSPMALGLCESVTQYIRAHGGAALFIDYGEAYTQADSLRGFLRHKQVNFLSSVGHVDISSDVDFHACRAAVHRTQANLLLAEAEAEAEAEAPAVMTPPGAGTIILNTTGSTMKVDFTRNSKPKPQSRMHHSVLVSDVVTQSDFLLRMGIIERVQQLLEYEAPGGANNSAGKEEGMQELTDEEANNLVSGMKMLVSPTEMGHRFKSICICHRDILAHSQGLNSYREESLGLIAGDANDNTGSVSTGDNANFPNMPAFSSFS